MAGIQEVVLYGIDPHIISDGFGSADSQQGALFLGDGQLEFLKLIL